ncbi:MAG: SHOCT domain-containing protein [Gordonia sp. (in: high G+C Gram-positive bacteria)]|uniref:SHOCT domain-containing protein n=1 Tax=Gordonia sp. (in: high G+C Gram-positive bacteria) TaxID=84139 RepID=UPI003BB5DFAE
MSLFKTAARAGVASAVHGRVQRRQQQRWAAQDAAAPPAPAPVPVAAQPSALAAASGASAIDDQIERLTKLAQLRDAGVLTEDEFTAKKAQILAL